MLAFRLALREIFNNRRFSAFFVLHIALGLFGFLSLDAFKTSVQASLTQRSREILGADLSVSARRPISVEENRILTEALPGASSVDALELYAMVISAKTSRLVEVFAVDDGFPFYGKIERAGTSSLHQKANGKPAMWVARDLLPLLSVNVGDTLHLGDTIFKISDSVTTDAGTSARGFSLASRVYMARDQIPGTHLLRRGSTVTYRRFYRLSPSVDAEALARDLNRRLGDPAVRVRSHLDASQSVGRLQGFLNDYLGLAALVSLFLASIGAAYLFRMFLQRRLKNVAILISLGLAPSRARRVYWIQLVLLGLIAALISLLLVYALLPGTIRFLAAFISYPMTPVLAFKSLWLTLAMGVAASLLVCLPFLLQLRRLKPADLFQEETDSATEFSARTVLFILPALVLYWGLAVWISQSWKTGSIFAGLFLGSVLVLGFIGWFLTASVARQGLKARFLPLQLALRNLSRSRVSSFSGFLAIGLGTLLISLIPQIQKSISTEVESPEISDVPSLFVFDIQPEQVEPLKAFLSKDGFALQSLTPLIRARLTAVNAGAFEKELETGQFRTREDETEQRFRNRGMNLTWRAGLSESEKIVEGRAFVPSPQPSPTRGEGASIPEISVEQRFAKRLKLKIGDVLRFDVQGVEIEGRIVNLRSVQWTSFQPNFFVQFEPGVLEDAPATWIASIGKTDREHKELIQRGIVSSFPNISIIDIGQVVDKLLLIFSQMGWAIRAMAFLSLFAGFSVLFSIAHQQASARRQEINLLKVLGMPFISIRRIFQLEFGLLGLLAAFAGGSISLGMSYILSVAVFDRVWAPAWETPLVSLVVMSLISVAMASLATRSVLRQKPIALLQSNT